MDGVINLFESDPCARENMWNEGYFESISPRDNIENDLIKISNYVDQIIILTKCIERSKVKEEKNKFIFKWLSKVPNLSVVYVPYKSSKRDYIDTTDFTILLDDQIKNVEECKDICNICILFDENDTYQYDNKVDKIIDIIRYIQ